MLLVCRVKWEPVAPEEEEEEGEEKEKHDKVEVSFHFAPLPNQPAWTESGPTNDLDFIALAGGDASGGVESQGHSQTRPAAETRVYTATAATTNYGDIWERAMAGLQRDFNSRFSMSAPMPTCSA